MSTGLLPRRSHNGDDRARAIGGGASARVDREEPRPEPAGGRARVQRAGRARHRPRGDVPDRPAERGLLRVIAEILASLPTAESKSGGHRPPSAYMMVWAAP